ncbi:MAG TPA: DUF3263 domain-containing protein [Microbacteriaceae bacterium]|nr:DUF3263 domain-containing protein [Microbacteriaceae bacterium]
MADSGPEASGSAAAPTDDTVRLLEFERAHRVHDGQKDEAIRDAFGVSAVQYYDRLSAVIDTPAAVRYDPILIRELRATRARLITARQARLFLPRS